jgi:hypothetical protein
MDHVVYLDAKAKELENLLAGAKTMVIRGAAGRKMPYARVNEGDILYFVRNNSEGLIKAKAVVSKVFNSEKMTAEESADLIAANQSKLLLSAAQLKRWSGKRFLVLIEVSEVEEIVEFSIDKSQFGNMDDWLLVEDINKVRVVN